VDGLPNIHPSQTPLAENNYRVRTNHSRYMNPEFGALLDRFATTIPRAERIEVLGQIIYHIADQLNIMGLYYGLEPTLISQRVENVTARHPQSTHAWNAHEWNVKS
jgi:ABC-type transport system substrate-binding protein